MCRKWPETPLPCKGGEVLTVTYIAGCAMPFAAQAAFTVL